ncbi:MAG: DNA cytosine methyltransferase [Rhodanobacter sp.]
MQTPPAPPLEVVSLFTGAGGLDLAFEQSAIRTLARVEIQPEFCATIKRAEALGHLAPAPLFAEDIRTVSVADVIAGTACSSGRRGVIGGPPCETFSTMGKRRGVEDPRGTLVMAFADFVMKSQADFFVLENVPQLEKADGGQVFRELLAKFTDAGYGVHHHVLNAADFGAATTRRRLFVVGLRAAPASRSAFRFPEATHCRDGIAKPSWIGAGTVLSGLPAPSRTPPGRPSGHVAINHTPNVIERFSGVPAGGYDYVRKRSRLTLKDPSVSLVAGNLHGTRAHIHPVEHRELTNRECARIQGFPDEFEFSGSPAAVAKQIANAVPIPLGAAIARSLLDYGW